LARLRSSRFSASNSAAVLPGRAWVVSVVTPSSRSAILSHRCRQDSEIPKLFATKAID
jgi:hypothetical protein